MAFMIAVASSFYTLPPLNELSSIIKNIAVVTGLVTGLATYISKVKQDKFNNSFALINFFTKHISETDLSVLREVHLSSYEGCRGHKPGHFATYQGTASIANPISGLFTSEGRGLIVHGRLGSIEDPAVVNGDMTCLGSVRLIAEQLNLIAFEVLRGQIEIRVVYYELNDVIKVVCFLLDTAMKMESRRSYSLEQRFKYLLKMRKKFPLDRFPRRTFSSTS
jgi:hypothetical protein